MRVWVHMCLFGLYLNRGRRCLKWSKLFYIVCLSVCFLPVHLYRRRPLLSPLWGVFPKAVSIPWHFHVAATVTAVTIYIGFGIFNGPSVIFFFPFLLFIFPEVHEFACVWLLHDACFSWFASCIYLQLSPPPPGTSPRTKVHHVHVLSACLLGYLVCSSILPLFLLLGLHV